MEPAGTTREEGTRTAGEPMCEALSMSSIQVADQTFVAASGERVAHAFASPARWRRWWPDLNLTITEDRGEKGIRWAVRGGVVGTMELWLEPALDGVIVHYFLHAEPAAGTDVAAHQHARRVAGRAMTFELKRELEAGRSAGEAPHHVASTSARE
ncbi:hypothetical protein NY08_668 [Rhodococcus sp. B7740]|nr:hypothetical protein NY08_668 [Rhodococcus sp. B7740]